MNKLWYKNPATIWEEALPIGNGRLGGMVYGGIDRELVQVNEESMWFGGPENRINPDAKENLEKIRTLLDEGRIAKASKLMELALSGCPEGMRCYQTLGEIQIFFDNLNGARPRKSGKIGNNTKTEEIETVSLYERELNLDTAITKTNFKCGETFFEREFFASNPADMIIMHFTSKGEDRISFTSRLRRGKWFDGVKKTSNHGIALYGNLGKNGINFLMELRAKVVGGQVTTIGESLCVEDAKEVFLYFSAVTSYNNDEENLDDVLNKKFENIWEKDYEDLKSEHLADYMNLYNRLQFELDGFEKFENIETDKRVENPDIYLGKKLFDFGRYLTIACSRKEGLPSTLQGLWNKEFFPPWDSKYTININTEMNYWHVEECNLSECHEPLFNLLKKMQVRGREVARKMYGCRGFVAHHNTDIYGDCAPQDIWYPGTYWTMGGAWICTHLWKHYLFTKDKEFLKEAFPIMVEACLFFVDFLVERNGYLVTSPSVSPENSYYLPNGESGAICIGATMDNQILRDLFSDCEKAWKELDYIEYENNFIDGVDDFKTLMQEIINCNLKLRPNEISQSGRIMEWMEDYSEVEPGHRHISHLYGLYPSGQINVFDTPLLAKAARKTLEYRLANGGGHTGWSRAWIINHYVSLYDGNEAFENINKMLLQSTYPNLFDKHPPFQIDGNFGVTAGIIRMFVQSSEDRLVLLPAVPDAWKSGRITGIRICGNAKLDIEWENGKLVSAKILPNEDYISKVIYEDKIITIQISAGETSNITF